MWPTMLSTFARVAREDDVDDLIAVDAHRERLLHRRLQQLPVLRLRRVRVPGDVGRLRARNGCTTTFSAFLTASTALNGTWSAQSMFVRLEVGDHRVGVRVVRQRDARCVRRRPVEVGVGLERRRPLLLVLRDRVGATADDRQIELRVDTSSGPCRRRRPSGAQTCSGRTKNCLELGEHVPDRRLVVDHERRRRRSPRRS